MPKERIYGRRGEAASNLDVMVEWGKAGVAYDVEENDGNVSVVLLDTADEGLADGDNEEHTRVWTALDRTAVNRLIRTLRRARDGAFGADA